MSTSPDALVAKRAKRAEPASEVLASTLHEDFNEFYGCLKLLKEQMQLDPAFVGQNYNTRIENGVPSLWAKLIVSCIRDQFKSIVFESPGGFLQTRTQFCPGGEYCTFVSWYFKKWAPVMEKRPTYGELYAMLDDLETILTSENPRKPMKFRELPESYFRI